MTLYAGSDPYPDNSVLAVTEVSSDDTDVQHLAHSPPSAFCLLRLS